MITFNFHPRTYDYTVREWGHDFAIMAVIDKGQSLRLCGWGENLRHGDYLILPNGKSSSRYRIRKVQYFSDPSDMCSATVFFCPRPRPAKNNSVSS